MPSPFPIIDISLIDDPEAQLSLAKQITDASSTWGFLLLKNHPIPPKAVDSMFALAQTFFALPPAQKDPWPINSRYMGYAAPLSDSKKDDKASMWLAGKPGQLQAYRDAIPPFWRDHIAEIEAFKHECHGLVIKLLRCFALAMDLPDRDFFAKAHAEDAGDGNRFRLLSYPPRANKQSEETTTRMSPHSDSGSVTLLFQTCAGLEVEAPSGSSWVPAPHIEGHILVNLGDALAFWSGGRLKATRHRVTFEGVPWDGERRSMAYFGAAGPETVLRPVVDADGREVEMGRYEANGVVIEPGITVGEYGRRIMESIYGAGVKRDSGVEVGEGGEVAT